MIITKYTKFNESLSHFDLRKLVTITAINKDEKGNWVYTTKDNRQLFLPADQVGKLTLVDDRLANYVNIGHPITKYFELDDNTIIYVANFAADAVAMKEGRVYLIERKDGRGWALPGGFIDEGETAEQAVIRELQEETKAKLEDIKTITPLELVRANDPREIFFYTYPFVLQMKNSTELEFGDDAKNGKWLLLNRAIKSDLAFSHHNEILKKVYF